MKKIAISLVRNTQGPVVGHKRVMSYGPTGSSKTHFAATWPRPLFLSDFSEHGWSTIEEMNRNYWDDPKVAPQVIAIEHPSEVMQYVQELSIAKQQGRTDPNGKIDQAHLIQTLVIDSLTLHSDAMLALLSNGAQQANKDVDMRRVYGKLGSYLQNLVIMTHMLPCHVVWLCLERSPTEEDPTGGPLLSGQASLKFPARCDYIFYHRANHVPGRAPTFEIRTRNFQKMPARVRGRLPDPITDVSYRGFLAALESAHEDTDTAPAADVPENEQTEDGGDQTQQPPAATPQVAAPIRAPQPVRRIVPAPPQRR